MKTLMVAVVLAILAGAAQADDLADGIKAWEAQDFAKAHKLLGKLAEAGNPEAQLMVGEMYGYGEGVAENHAVAESWISKAKAGGHKDAAESLNTLKQRGAHKQDIAYYVSAYKGDDVKLEKYACVKPVFPQESRTQNDIKAVKATMDAWNACYERFGQGLAAAQPAGKAIPQEVAKVMSLAELQQARTAMDKVYGAVAADGHSQAREVLAAHDKWAANTKEWTISMQQKTKNDLEQRNRERDMLTERYRQTMGLGGSR
jgi:TPR repeat protein